jgi:transposase
MLESMPKKIDYQLSEEELETVEQAIRYEKDVRVVKRANGIRLLHQGHSPQEVAEMLLVSDVSVYNWHARWRAQGIEGLRDAPRSGRPPIADERYRQAIDEALASDPGEHGYEFAIWTIERLREHLAIQTGSVLSYTRLREVLDEMDYVYRRPTQDLSHAQDQAAHDQAEALIEALKKGPNKVILSSSLWTKRP